MKFTPTAIPEVVLIEPDVHKDARGFFLESYHQQKYSEEEAPGVLVHVGLDEDHLGDPHRRGKAAS